MTESGQTPPGWYPDASGTRRWWDGTAWTEHTEGQAQPAWGGATAWNPTHYLAGAGSDFGDAITNAINNAFEYRGRASRSSYWWFQLGSFVGILAAYIVGLIIIVIVHAISSTLGGIVGIVFLLAFLAALVYLILVNIALSIRRLHDTDKSGWWYLLSLVPFGGIVLLVFFVIESTPHRNQYDIPELAG